MGAKPYDAVVLGIKAAEEYCRGIGGATTVVHVPAKEIAT